MFSYNFINGWMSHNVMRLPRESQDKSNCFKCGIPKQQWCHPVFNEIIAAEGMNEMTGDMKGYAVTSSQGKFFLAE